jgi:hypothetical protein
MLLMGAFAEFCSLDSIFQKTLVITFQKRAFQPGDAFEDIVFKTVLIISKSKSRCGVTALHLFLE